MASEDANERYEFTCRRCPTQWTADYNARHVTNLTGDTFSFYRQNGIPCVAPAAADIICPTCHRTSIHAMLLAAIPFPALDIVPHKQRPELP